MSDNNKNMEKILQESKRFMQLCEYSFIGMTEEDDATTEPEPAEPTQDQSEPNDIDIDSEVSSVEDELGVSDDGNSDGDSEDIDTGVNDTEGDMADEEPQVDEPEPQADEIEIDMTDLVNQNARVEKGVSVLMSKIDGLMMSINKMNSISTKIDKLSSEINAVNIDIKKRMPTPQEKIEMRSVNSYPYNLKLTDYWTDGNSEPVKPVKPKNNMATGGYSDIDVKRSLYDFEEEDI